MTKLLNLLNSSFLRKNALLFGASVVVGALNYLYSPVLGRMLDPASFGEVQTLVSLFLQVSIFLIVLGVVVTNITKNYADETKRDHTIFELQKFALIIACVIFAIIVAFSPILSRALHFGSVWPFIIFGLAIVASVPLFFKIAVLRGKQKFVQFALAQILSAGGKLVASVIFVFLGLGTVGALFGIVVAQIGAWFYAKSKTAKIDRTIFTIRQVFTKPKLKEIRPELRYSFFVFLGSFGIMSLCSVDVIIVKYFFSAEIAGLYAGVATVARGVFFLTASISQVMLGVVQIGSQKNSRLLFKSFILLFAISLPVCLILILFPSQITSLLMGPSYQELSFLLPKLVVANFTISILNLLVLYFLALRRVIVSIIAIIGFVASCIWMVNSHDSLNSIVNSLLIGSFVTLLTVLLWWLGANLTWRKNGKSTFNIGSSPDL